MISYRTIVFGAVVFVCAAAPALAADSVPAVPRTSAPIHTMADSVPAVPKDSVPAVPKDSVPAVPKVVSGASLTGTGMFAALWNLLFFTIVR